MSSSERLHLPGRLMGQFRSLIELIFIRLHQLIDCYVVSWWLTSHQWPHCGHTKIKITYRTRPHRRTGSASVGQEASTANKQTYPSGLSNSFQIPFENVQWFRYDCSVVKTVPGVNHSFWEEVMPQFSRCSLLHKLEWMYVILFVHTDEIQRRCQMIQTIFLEWFCRPRLDLLLVSNFLCHCPDHWCKSETRWVPTLIPEGHHSTPLTRMTLHRLMRTLCILLRSHSLTHFNTLPLIPWSTFQFQD